MYVEGGFMNNMGLAGVVFPNSAMWSLQVKVTVDETISKGGLVSEESIFTLVPTSKNTTYAKLFHHMDGLLKSWEYINSDFVCTFFWGLEQSEIKQHLKDYTTRIWILKLTYNYVQHRQFSVQIGQIGQAWKS